MGWGVWLLLAATSSGAQGSPIFLDYPSVQGCPSKQEFFQQVRARTSLAQLAPTADGVAVYRIVLGQGQAEIRGRLEVQEGGQSTRVRELTGATCPELMSAMALTVALTIDPRASETGPSPQINQRKTKAARRAPEDEPSPKSHSTDAPAQYHLRVGVKAVEMTAIAPGWTPAGALFFEGRRLGSSSASLRLGAQVAASGKEPLGPGAAQFDYVGGVLEACPVIVGDQVSVAACVSGQLGRVRARGMDVPASHTSNELWAAVDGVVRAQFALFRWLVLEVDAGVVFPLIRRTYVFDGPRTVAWEAPVAGTVLGLGAAVPIL
jgi:hypothetical protein